ncbi:MSL1 [Lepeophtheirus salmonis]|uniref:MSL1 n=1 Tax=Lepeophtheirus salmonis TaxID=72036 RepID=A0A7R8H583_LEPSM|nr:MSL1 [Lepeophtheirus salmonis]CAF2873803.1 MSL1 [Lepeophtheirus salmonis]
MSSGDPETFLKAKKIGPQRINSGLKNMFLSQLETIRASSIRIKDRNQKLLDLQKENEDLLRQRLCSMENRRKGSKEPCLNSFLDLENPTSKQTTSSPVAKTTSPPPTAYLRTNEPYYTSQNCQLPDWRVIPESVSKGPSSKERIENLEDNTILKRHYKFEVDEIKRKKWDLQRLRALRQTERLKARNVAKEDVIHSVEPNVDSLTHICVADYLPISVFGAPLPLLPKNAIFP